MARKHLEKSEYNAKVMKQLEESKNLDWALNVGFYAIYHCFLSILSKFGYESRNQSCTITVILKLIDENKLPLGKDLVSQFDTLEVDKDAHSTTIRQSREISTYGIKTQIDLGELKDLKELIVKIQRATIQIINE